MPRLEGWSITDSGLEDAYKAPEQRTFRLFGQVFDHSSIEDGKTIRTSAIIGASGKTVKTRSGSVYELGNISQDYLDWMESNKILYDPENPIKIKG